MEIKKVITNLEIKQLKEFLLAKSSFDFKLTEGEIEEINGLDEGILLGDFTYWLAIESDKVVGVIGVFLNDYRTGGFEFDFFAVNKDYRRRGVGKLLLDELEKFVKEGKGRFVIVSTGSADTSLSARNFYEKYGYLKVGETPDFFEEGDNKIDYYKRLY